MGNNKWEYEDFQYDDFTYDDYMESSDVTNSRNALDTHLTNKPGEYQSQWGDQLNSIMNSILNRDKFSYDLNGDALYQQYKDKYIQQGKLAMGDAIGQASAMTGGYGSSYAQSVGQQQYQASLDNLNDIVPQLYQMALDKYTMEGQELYNQYGMVADRENTDYGRHRDTVADWNTDRDYLAGRYDSERNYDYSRYNTERNFDYGRYSDDRSLAYDEYATDKNLSYDEYRAAIADEQWQQEFDATQEHNAWVRSQASSGGSSDGSDGSGGGYDNGGLTNSQIAEMQRALGIDADGKWGSGSSKAAGGLTAAQAWDKYKKGLLGNKQPSVEPTESAATTSFMSYVQTKSEYLARGHSEKEFNTYIEDKIVSFLRDDRLTDSEALYLVQYYGLS